LRSGECRFKLARMDVKNLNEVRAVKTGDAIAISPGSRHRLWNTSGETMTLLCCCAPAYEHSDTVLL